MKGRFAFLVLLGCGCQVNSEVGSNLLLVGDAAAFIDSQPLLACADRLDNDMDGNIDFPFDPGCDDVLDDDESTPEPAPVCSVEVDDDSDGIIDFPQEPGCESAADQDETDPLTAPACADGIDNDNNGEIDFPEDIGCYAAGDENESSVTS